MMPPEKPNGNDSPAKPRGIAAKWAEISLEKKLSLFVAPVAIAIITGLVIPSIARRINKEPEDAPRLEVLDVAVGGGLGPGRFGEPPPELQHIDVTVRNTGKVISVVKGALFRINRFAHLEICEAGGGLEASKNYDVVLPVEPKPGQVVRTKVSQQIAPNEADRFLFKLTVPKRDLQLGKYLYEIDIGLFHDSGNQPLNAGRVLVSVPDTVSAFYFAPQLASEEGEVGECYRSNAEKLRRMLSSKGERVPELNEELLRGPA